jgi:hypothetical protein
MEAEWAVMKEAMQEEIQEIQHIRKVSFCDSTPCFPNGRKLYNSVLEDPFYTFQFEYLSYYFQSLSITCPSLPKPKTRLFT